MKEDFLLYFRLENAYVVNHFIHTLHRIPLIKKLVEGRSYDAKGLKVLGTIYRPFRDIIMMFFFKALYYLGLLGFAALVADGRYGAVENTEIIGASAAEIWPIFITVFIFMTLIGAIFNNKLFDTGEHSYYAVNLLRVDARNYAIINYAFVNLKHFIMNFLVSLIVLFGFKLPPVTALMMAFFILGAKLSVQALELKFIDFSHKHNNLFSVIKIVTAILFAVAMCMVIFTKHEFSTATINTIFIVFILLGAVGALVIINYKDYARVYKKEMALVRNAVEEQKTNAKQKEQKLAKNALSDKTITASSNKTGFAYLNDLFMKRHHKSLWGVVRIQAIVIAVVFAFMSAAFIIFPEESDGFSDLIITWIPAIMFLMYCLNRGQSFTSCLFVNCDHSFLTYPFFKEPKLILRLFTLRLWSLIKLNIFPAILIGLGLSSVYFITSHSTSGLDYFVLFVSPVAMSVFFSIHYMMLYYILQPFTKDAEVDSVPYKVINIITYIVSYMMLQMKIGSFMFGIGTIIFCVIYSIIAVLLVYKKAAKTFRIKN